MADSQVYEIAYYIDGVKGWLMGGLVANGSAIYTTSLSTDKKTLTLTVKSYDGDWDDGPRSPLTITSSKEILYYPLEISMSTNNYIWTYKVTDLTSTKWLLNYLKPFTYSGTDASYDLDIHVGGSEGILANNLSVAKYEDTNSVCLILAPDDTSSYEGMILYAQGNDIFDCTVGSGEEYSKIFFSTGGLDSTLLDEPVLEGFDLRILYIVAGESTTNTAVIDWLYANATLLEAPEPTPTKKFTRLYNGLTKYSVKNGKYYKQLCTKLLNFEINRSVENFPLERSSGTFGEWVSSPYNVNKYVVDEFGYILQPQTSGAMCPVLDNTSIYVTKDTQIIEDETYEVSLAEKILFRIDGKTYYGFEKSLMDVEGWVNSLYNIDGFYLDVNDVLRNANGLVVLNQSGTHMTAGASFEDDEDYSLRNEQHSGGSS